MLDMRGTAHLSALTLSLLGEEYLRYGSRMRIEDSVNDGISASRLRFGDLNCADEAGWLTRIMHLDLHGSDK